MIKFKSIRIRNYKGFVDSGEIDLSIPDMSTPGSGLNIFVGENGSGKTTILKAMSLITSQSGRYKISSCDFNNKTKLPEIKIEITPVDYFKYALPFPFRRTLDIKQFVLTIKHRLVKSPGKMFSDMLQISNIVEPTARTYTSKGVSNALSDFFLQFDTEHIKDDDLRIFYFDRSRNLQVRTGYNSTLSSVLEDLNWKFLTTTKQEDILKLWKAYYDGVVNIPLGNNLGKEISDSFNSSVFENIKLQLINLSEPFLNGFFAKSAENNFTQVPLSELGSGVEFIFSILFLKHISDNLSGTIIYCIDEPELSLHPQWQKALFELLKQESTKRQIFISTHSPHFIDTSLLGNVKKFSCNDSGEISMTYLLNRTVSDAKTKDLFNLENREIFFARSTILVEGWEDCKRIRKFLQTNNISLFVIFGLQNFEKAQKVCQDLRIKFKAIVDLDYLQNDSTLLPDLTQDELDALNEINTLDSIVGSTDDEIVKKEVNKIKTKIQKNKLCVLSSKIKSKMTSDASYANKIMKKIKTLRRSDIYVLPNGIIEDYLDEAGKAKSDAFGKELLSIIKT